MYSSEGLRAPAGHDIPFSSEQQAKQSSDAPLRFLQQPHRNLVSLQEDAPLLGVSPSAASLSSESFASALSEDLQAQDTPPGRHAIIAMPSQNAHHVSHMSWRCAGLKSAPIYVSLGSVASGVMKGCGK